MFVYTNKVTAAEQDKLRNVTMSIHQGKAISLRIIPKLSITTDLGIETQLKDALEPLSKKGWDVEIWVGSAEDD